MKSFLKIPLLLLFIFSFSCSETDDDCTPVNCTNGGSQTVDCQCDCLDGFSGFDCSVQLTPTTIKITKIVVKKFPDSNDGVFWDPFDLSDADIYIQVLNSSETIIYDSDIYYPDASGLNIEYEFIPESPINLTSFLNINFIVLYDYDDLNSDDLISALAFTPYESTGGFPTTISRTNTLGTFECDITFEYTW